MKSATAILTACLISLLSPLFHGCSIGPHKKFASVLPDPGAYSRPEEIVKHVFLATYPLRGFGGDSPLLIRFTNIREIKAIQPYVTGELYLLMSTYSKLWSEANALHNLSADDQIIVAGLSASSQFTDTMDFPPGASFAETISGDNAQVVIRNKYEVHQDAGHPSVAITSTFHFVKAGGAWRLSNVNQDWPSSDSQLIQSLRSEIQWLRDIIKRTHNH